MGAKPCSIRTKLANFVFGMSANQSVIDGDQYWRFLAQKIENREFSPFLFLYVEKKFFGK